VYARESAGHSPAQEFPPVHHAGVEATLRSTERGDAGTHHLLLGGGAQLVAPASMVSICMIRGVGICITWMAGRLPRAGRDHTEAAG
jgi:hypothetical protein